MSLPPSSRQTRQAAKALAANRTPANGTPDAAGLTGSDQTVPQLSEDLSPDAPSSNNVTALPSDLGRGVTGLRPTQHRLLLKKQALLRQHGVTLPAGLGAPARKAADATLVFAQREAGTAVCVSAGGLLLTCAHCVAETPKDFEAAREHWLLFASGRAVRARCVAWDPKRDLALLMVTAAQPGDAGAAAFPCLAVARAAPALSAGLVCVGHPRGEDLAAARPGARPLYDILHVSTGAYRGLAAGQDAQDNSEIGALMHDCWTYWGHSGAPLVERKTGQLVGLHSSWDDATGVRRGVALEALREFLAATRLVPVPP